ERWSSSRCRPSMLSHLLSAISLASAARFAAAAFLLTRVEYGNRRVVGEQRLRSEDMVGEPRLQRLQPPGGAANPVGERRAVQLDTMPGEDLALPVERKVIAVFGD